MGEAEAGRFPFFVGAGLLGELRGSRMFGLGEGGGNELVSSKSLSLAARPSSEDDNESLDLVSLIINEIIS